MVGRLCVVSCDITVHGSSLQASSVNSPQSSGGVTDATLEKVQRALCFHSTSVSNRYSTMHTRSDGNSVQLPARASNKSSSGNGDDVSNNDIPDVGSALKSSPLSFMPVLRVIVGGQLQHCTNVCPLKPPSRSTPATERQSVATTSSGTGRHEKAQSCAAAPIAAVCVPEVYSSTNNSNRDNISDVANNTSLSTSTTHVIENTPTTASCPSFSCTNTGGSPEKHIESTLPPQQYSTLTSTATAAVPGGGVVHGPDSRVARDSDGQNHHPQIIAEGSLVDFYPIDIHHATSNLHIALCDWTCDVNPLLHPNAGCWQEIGTYEFPVLGAMSPAVPSRRVEITGVLQLPPIYPEPAVTRTGNNNDPVPVPVSGTGSSGTAACDGVAMRSFKGNGTNVSVDEQQQYHGGVGGSSDVRGITASSSGGGGHTQSTTTGDTVDQAHEKMTLLPPVVLMVRCVMNVELYLNEHLMSTVWRLSREPNLIRALICFANANVIDDVFHYNNLRSGNEEQRTSAHLSSISGTASSELSHKVSAAPSPCSVQPAYCHKPGLKCVDDHTGVDFNFDCYSALLDFYDTIQYGLLPLWRYCVATVKDLDGMRYPTRSVVGCMLMWTILFGLPVSPWTRPVLIACVAVYFVTISPYIRPYIRPYMRTQSLPFSCISAAFLRRVKINITASSSGDVAQCSTTPETASTKTDVTSESDKTSAAAAAASKPISDSAGPPATGATSGFVNNESIQFLVNRSVPAPLKRYISEASSLMRLIKLLTVRRNGVRIDNSSSSTDSRIGAGDDDDLRGGVKPSLRMWVCIAILCLIIPYTLVLLRYCVVCGILCLLLSRPAIPCFVLRVLSAASLYSLTSTARRRDHFNITQQQKQQRGVGGLSTLHQTENLKQMQHSMRHRQ
eukprot:Lankesteria_metandrocarpae@DN4924_c0_g1_i1.p1